jgi:hypothetical protein
MEDLVDRPSDPWIAGEVRSVLAASLPVVEAIEAFWARAAKPTDEIFAELGLPTE